MIRTVTSSWHSRWSGRLGESVWERAVTWRILRNKNIWSKFYRIYRKLISTKYTSITLINAKYKYNYKIKWIKRIIKLKTLKYTKSMISYNSLLKYALYLPYHVFWLGGENLLVDKLVVNLHTNISACQTIWIKIINY